MKKNQNIKCNLCGSDGYSIYLDRVTSWEHRGSFRIVRCNNCSLIYLNPRPHVQRIKHYYPIDDYWSTNLLNVAQEVRSQGFGPLYELIFNIKKRGKIIDVGTGNGMFLTLFEEKGWKVLGTDVSKQAIKIAKEKYGIKVLCGDFANLRIRESYFDVVTFNNSLEHTYDPNKNLKKAFRLLKDGGLLVITVPNIESLGFYLFKRNWTPLQPPRHLYHFSLNTLKLLLEHAGFEIKGQLPNYKTHIIYSLFESFRTKFSPRFKQKNDGGLADTQIHWQGFFSKYLKHIFVSIVHILIRVIYLFELGTGRTEVITIYAVKKNI